MKTTWLTMMHGSISDRVLRSHDTEQEAVACCKEAQAAYLAQYHGSDRPLRSEWEDGVSDAEKIRRCKEGPMPVARLYNLALSFGVVKIEGETAGEYRPVILANGKECS